MPRISKEDAEAMDTTMQLPFSTMEVMVDTPLTEDALSTEEAMVVLPFLVEEAAAVWASLVLPFSVEEVMVVGTS